MPFYDLHCSKCEKEFNILASMTEKSEKLIPCPGCGSFDLETLFNSAPAYIKNLKTPQGCPNQSYCGSKGCHQ